jgi:hypothetical protein
MAFGMDRHTEEGERPEAEGPNSAYGSAIHKALHLVEADDLTDEQAAQAAFDEYGKWLEPDDVDRMDRDLATYHERDYLGVRTVAAEQDFRVPLMKWPCNCVGTEMETPGCDDCRGSGEIQIYFRFKLDRLYQRIDDPGAFLAIDYKSSKWAKTQKEVNEDTQMWAYNWAIHEIWPECERLEQVYDQLVHGPLYTRKAEAQRKSIKRWLIRQVTTILKNEEVEEDGLPRARFNQWCAYCEILMSCPVVPRLSDFAQTKIKAQREEIDGLDLGDTLVDASDLSRFVNLLKPAGDGKKALEEYERQVKGVLRSLPKTTREELGYRLSERSRDKWEPESMRAALDLLGPIFFQLISLTKGKLEEAELDESDREAVMKMATKAKSNPALVAIRR